MNAVYRLSCAILGFVLVSCSPAPLAVARGGPAAAQTAKCSGEQVAAAEAMVKGLSAAVNSLDADKMAPYYADDVVFEDLAYGDHFTDKTAVLAMYRSMFSLPDIKFETNSLFVSADCTQAAVEWTWSGTKGGQPYSTKGVVIYEMRGSKVARESLYYASFSKPY